MEKIVNTNNMEMITQHPIKKSDLGFHGNLFGGQLLKWIDASAAGYAMQLCDTPRMVTVSIDTSVILKNLQGKASLLKYMGFLKPLAIARSTYIWKLERTVCTLVNKLSC